MNKREEITLARIPMAIAQAFISGGEGGLYSRRGYWSRSGLRYEAATTDGPFPTKEEAVAAERAHAIIYFGRVTESLIASKKARKEAAEMVALLQQVQL